MDINTARSLVTAAAFVAFIGIVWWAYGKSRQSHFDQIARSVLEDDKPQREGNYHG
jgi:cytochrome c oxidase cbb3-type subunit 4